MRQRLTDARNGTEHDAGFTLIELIVVVTILPIILGAIATALISVFSLQNSVSNRVGDSNDALVASASFNRDAQSAEMMTTQATPAACGSLGNAQTQLLAMEWGANSLPPSSGGPAGGYDTVVSYISTQGVNPQTHVTSYTLTRQICSFGTSTTPTTTLTLAHDIGSSPTVTIYGPKNAQGAFTNITPDFANSWFSTLSVTKVEFDVQGAQTASGFSYSLVGLPGQSKSQANASQLNSPSSTIGCGFATPNSQSIYANQLCFADFSSYNYSAASTGTCRPPGLPTQTGQLYQLPIENTPYSLSFCLRVSAPVLAPSVLPTFYNPSGDNSEAFLGNNGFYTGVPGNEEPALYMNASGSYVTMTFTAVQVLDAAGQPATGWTLVAGDSESTDTNEWIEFSNTTGGLNWSILPNNGSSDLWGNACFNDANTTTNNSGALAWTGPVPATTSAVGTPSSGPPPTGNWAPLNVNSTSFATGVSSILCESDQQLNKTGTMMVQAQEPTSSSAPQSMSISMKGAGLEGIFVGILL
jgi:prepilin-type N-terminal cleavage/methylation domain-containing protein